ncbi:MAG TPA: stage II sporulation protein P [Selenomonadales bacterium]|nr:stage II sporulation protein P [Selenomonadales bacterium]
MITRRERKQQTKQRLWGAAIALAVLVIGFFGLHFGGHGRDAVPVSAALPGAESRIQSYMPKWRDVLSLGIPGLNRADEQPGPVKVQPVTSAQSLLRNMVIWLTGIDIKDPRSLLQAEIPFSSLFQPASPAINALTLPNFPKFDWKSMTSPGKPLVGIYHTHTSESFIPWSGVTHRPAGQRGDVGDIVEVGDALVKRLAQYNIGAVQSRAIHDSPSFMKAYGPSEITAQKMLADNPSLQMLFDIHRDAGKKEDFTVMINGLPAARLSIVVAMGQQDLVQPHWQQNHAFAKLIDSKLNQHFPGISAGIKLEDWRYNQHLHPRALLIEVGCQENTKEEVIRSIELFGDVIAEIFAES